MAVELFIDLNKCIFGSFKALHHKPGDEENIVYPMYFPFNSFWNFKPVMYDKPINRKHLFSFTPVAVPGTKGVPLRIHFIYDSTKNTDFRMSMDTSVHERLVQAERTIKNLSITNAQLTKDIAKGNNPSEIVADARKILGSKSSEREGSRFGGYGNDLGGALFNHDDI